ncbi:MAG TPA: phytanoyl-CoA dioxygenase family protein [Methylomirabilota bacterium]|nr:phytanoyl-CoA dioxygenase family protein [Methylomirabilota bacterium]
MRKNSQSRIIREETFYVDGKMNLTSEVEKSGYGILPGVVCELETRSLLDELAGAGLPRSRAGIRHVMGNPGVSRIAHAENILLAVREILGDGAIPFRATLFDKSPTSNWLVMWHQDTALPLLDKRESEGWGPWSVKDGVTYAHAPAKALEKVLAVRLHLDDSNLHNGPLRILPGTHTAGVLTDEEIHKLSEDVPGVECPVPQGGAILMRPLVVHASSKSVSNEPRRVIHIEYAAQKEILPGMTLAIA